MNPIRLETLVFAAPWRARTRIQRSHLGFGSGGKVVGGVGKRSQDPSADLDRLMTVIIKPS